MKQKKIIYTLVASLTIVGGVLGYLNYEQNMVNKNLQYEVLSLTKDKDNQNSDYQKQITNLKDANKNKSEVIANISVTLAKMYETKISLITKGLVGKPFIILNDEFNTQKKFLTDELTLLSKDNQSTPIKPEVYNRINEINIFLNIADTELKKLPNEVEQAEKVTFYSMITVPLEVLKEKTGSQKLEFCPGSEALRKEIANNYLKDWDLLQAYENKLISQPWVTEEMEKNITLSYGFISKSYNERIKPIAQAYLLNKSDYTLFFECKEYDVLYKASQGTQKSINLKMGLMDTYTPKLKEALKPVCMVFDEKMCNEAFSQASFDLFKDQSSQFEGNQENILISAAAYQGFAESSRKLLNKPRVQNDSAKKAEDVCMNPIENKNAFISNYDKYISLDANIESKISSSKVANNNGGLSKPVIRGMDKIKSIYQSLKQNNTKDINCKDMAVAFNTIKATNLNLEKINDVLDNYTKIFKPYFEKYCQSETAEKCTEITEKAANRTLLSLRTFPEGEAAPNTIYESTAQNVLSGVIMKELENKMWVARKAGEEVNK